MRLENTHQHLQKMVKCALPMSLVKKVAALPKRQGVNWKQRQVERLSPEGASFHWDQKRHYHHPGEKHDFKRFPSCVTLEN